MKKAAWIVLGLVSLVSVGSFLKYFDKIYPIVNVNVTMDRQEALQKALEFAQNNQFDVQGCDTALQFKEDGALQAFVELEGGGKEAFKEMIIKKYYQPYQWVVRFYKPNHIHELLVHFTADGQFNGFLAKIPESQKGAALTKNQALDIALEQVAKLQVVMDCYCLVEHNMIQHPSGRVDHSFVFERSDITLEKGLYRIKLQVFGDTFSGLEKSVKIPDEFVRRYKQMFADNKLIATLAQNIGIFLYLFVIAMLLLFSFYKDRSFLLLKNHGIVTLGFFFTIFIARINKWEFLWNYYPTNISPFLFGLKELAGIFAITALFSIFVGVIFALSNAADRYVFGKHIQILKSWSHEVIGTYQLFEMTLLSYAGAAIFLGYQVIYSFWTESMGWWAPLNTLFDPNVLSTYVPFVTPIVNAFQAGFFEEILCRGLPLAGVAFLTRNSKYKKWWFVAILIVQAIIFGALHANYPQQPAYNRMVEMFIPSLMFAFFYYVYGLLPGIIIHFLYDAVLMCIPIWISDLYLHKILAALCILTPLLIVLVSWIRQNRRFKEVPLGAYNDALVYKDSEVTESVYERKIGSLISFKHVMCITIFTVLGFGFSYFSNQWNFFNAPCKIPQVHAIRTAQEALEQYGLTSEQGWIVAAELSNKNDSSKNKFIWQTYGGFTYQNLEKDYVPAHFWHIVWKKFDGSIEDRSESFEAQVSVDGTILSLAHAVAESKKGVDLETKHAEKIALELIKNIYNIDSCDLVLSSSESVKHQQRRDYVIKYKQTDRYQFDDNLGQADITVKLAGDQLVYIGKTIRVPEAWQRIDQSKNSQDLMVRVILYSLCLMIMVFAFGLALKNIKLTIQFLVSVLFFTSLYFLIKILSLLNAWNQILLMLNTAEPWFNQIVSIILSSAIYFMAIGCIYIFTLKIFVFNGTKSQFNRYFSWALLLVLMGMACKSFAMWFDQFAFSSQALDYQYQLINFKVPVYGMLIAYFLESVLFKALQLMSFSLVAQWMEDRNKTYLQLPFFLIMGIVVSDVASVLNIPLWIISGIIIGFVYYLINRYVLSQDISAVFLIAFGMSIMKLLPSVWCLVYPGILLQFMVSLVIFGSFLLYAYRKI